MGLRQAFLEIVHQLPDFRRQVPLLRVQRPYRGIRRLVAFQQGDQAAAAQMLDHIVVRQLAQAEAAQGGVEHRLAAVAAPVALDPVLGFPAVLEEAPQVAAADQAIELAEFRRRLRSAVAAQVFRGGAEVHEAWRQPCGDQSRIAQAAEADGQVEALVEQVQLAVGQLDVDPQLRIVGHEGIHQRHDETFAVGHRAGHAQQALGSAERSLTARRASSRASCRRWQCCRKVCPASLSDTRRVLR